MPRSRRKVAVLGATGTVGQRIVAMLHDHPWFELSEVAASEQSAGKKYIDAVRGRWMLDQPIPPEAYDMPVRPCVTELESELVFSALDSSVAGPIEDDFAEAGHCVCSNSKNHRMDEDVPLVIPDVNPYQLDILGEQRQRRRNRGYIVTNPNCSTIGLALALKPMHDEYGIKSVHVVTMQAISGAGYPGIPSMYIIDNVIPCISGEEEKIEKETKKILGGNNESRVFQADIEISAQCNRVNVIDGHLECVSIDLIRHAEPEALINALQNHSSQPQALGLPTAPEQPIVYLNEDDRPQTRLDRYLGEGRSIGMPIAVGRLRKDDIFDYKFVLLCHNTIRGAAGAALLNGELLEAKGYLRNEV